MNKDDKLLHKFKSKYGEIRIYTDKNAIPKDLFYQRLAKVHYEHLQYIKQKKEA